MSSALQFSVLYSGLSSSKVVNMTGQYDFTIHKGVSWTPQLTWTDDNGTPIDLTGYSASMDIKAAATDSTSILSFSTSGGEIVLGTSDGTIAITATNAQTSAVTANSGVYDLFLTSSSGVVKKLMQGEVEFVVQVTK